MSDLVIQGPALDTDRRDVIIRRFLLPVAAGAPAGVAGAPTDTAGTPTGTAGIVPLRYGSGVRLRGLSAPASPPAADDCYDLAWVPEDASLGGFRLLAFDMDSTLISVECIDEIADMAGLKTRVASITERAMRGEIPFARSLRQRVALLRGLPEATLARVYDERVRLSPGAETLLGAARAAGVATLLVSGGFSFFTERLRQRLSIDRACANSLETAQGCLTGRIEGAVFDGGGKAAAVRAFAAELGAPRGRIMVVGDGANDLPMMKEAGVSIAFRAKPAVRAQADYALDHSGLDGILNLFPPAGA